MRVLNLDPFGFVLAFHDADFVVGSAALALSQNADINFVGENALDGFVCPFAVSPVLKTVSNFTPAECLYSIGDRTPIWFRRFAIRPMEKPSLYMERSSAHIR